MCFTTLRFAPQALGFREGYEKGVEEYKPIPSYSQGLKAPPDQVWQENNSANRF